MIKVMNIKRAGALTNTSNDEIKRAGTLANFKKRITKLDGKACHCLICK